MDEFRAALGIYQLRRLSDIVGWKNRYAQSILDPIYPNRVILPHGMISNYYKYIVFGQVEPSNGRVYDSLCHKHFGVDESFPNSEWVASSHSCVPIYYDSKGAL